MIDLHDAQGPTAGASLLISCPDTGDAEELGRSVERALSLGHTRLIVELGPLHGGDSDVLGVLHRSAKRVRRVGGALVVVCADSGLRRLLDLTLLDRSFRVCATREEAFAG